MKSSHSETQPLFYQNNRGEIIKLSYSKSEDELKIDLDDTDPDLKKPDAYDGYIKYRIGRPTSGEVELKTMLASPKGSGLGSFLVDLLLAEANELKLTSVRTLNTNPEAFPFYRSLGFTGDEKSSSVTGKSIGRDGKEVDESSFSEWTIAVDQCKKNIDAKSKPTTAWRAISSNYNNVMTDLNKLGLIDDNLRTAIMKNSEILIPINKMLTTLREEIDKHIENAGSGFTMRFAKTIAQKHTILKACKMYLKGDITKEKLHECISQNPKYSTAFGTSKTKSIVDDVLSISQTLKEITAPGIVKKPAAP